MLYACLFTQKGISSDLSLMSILGENLALPGP